MFCTKMITDTHTFCSPFRNSIDSTFYDPADDIVRDLHQAG